jgi:plastocyanin
VVEFRFPPGGFSMKVLEARPGELVRWEVVEGPEEWVGTTVNWKLKQSGEYTVVLFEHLGWKEPVEFMYHCSTKWASYLLSLKSLVETGTGAPSPHDVMISDWH